LLSLVDDALSRIGVWYDYTSTPQAPANRGQLVVALERIHELLGACNLITLRHPGDDYDARAWCAAEVAIDPDIDRTRFRKICVRLDKIGEASAEVLLDQQLPEWAEIAEFTVNQLRARSLGPMRSTQYLMPRVIAADQRDPSRASRWRRWFRVER
jgi:hypothetical protein